MNTPQNRRDTERIPDCVDADPDGGAASTVDHSPVVISQTPESQASDSLQTIVRHDTEPEALATQVLPFNQQATAILSRHSPAAKMPSPGELAPVSVKGYEILGELGRGGMGVVYRARQTSLNRIFALKMILVGGHAGSDQLTRFRAEAGAVAKLQHPNIVQVYDIGEQEGLPYFSLEFVDGTALDRVLAGKPQPESQAAQTIEVLARAMQYAHERSIIHRDLKPADVLVSKTGIPKISDFGLAKQLESDSRKTRTGTIMGTPSYMAP
jgi:serine/threonine-protein kinase